MPQTNSQGVSQVSVNPGQAKDQFKAHYVELLQSRLGVGFAVGVVLVPLFAVVDWRLARPFFGLFLSLRLGAAAVMALLWLINRRRSGQAWQEGLTIAGALTVAVMLETMLVAMGGTGSNYYAGLTLLLIAAIVLIPIRLGVAVCLAASVLLVYLVPLAIADTPLLGATPCCTTPAPCFRPACSCWAPTGCTARPSWGSSSCGPRCRSASASSTP